MNYRSFVASLATITLLVGIQTPMAVRDAREETLEVDTTERPMFIMDAGSLSTRLYKYQSPDGVPKKFEMGAELNAINAKYEEKVKKAMAEAGMGDTLFKNCFCSTSEKSVETWQLREILTNAPLKEVCFGELLKEVVGSTKLLIIATAKTRDWCASESLEGCPELVALKEETGANVNVQVLTGDTEARYEGKGILFALKQIDNFKANGQDFVAGSLSFGGGSLQVFAEDMPLSIQFGVRTVQGHIKKCLEGKEEEGGPQVLDKQANKGRMGTPENNLIDDCIKETNFWEEFDVAFQTEIIGKLNPKKKFLAHPIGYVLDLIKPKKPQFTGAWIMGQGAPGYIGGYEHVQLCSKGEGCGDKGDQPAGVAETRKPSATPAKEKDYSPSTMTPYWLTPTDVASRLDNWLQAGQYGTGTFTYIAAHILSHVVQEHFDANSRFYFAKTWQFKDGSTPKIDVNFMAYATEAGLV